MKEKWQKIFNIVSVVLLVICTVRIGGLQNDIQNLKNTVYSEYNTLHNSINSISSSVGWELEQANNILSDSGWETGNLNMEDKTVIFHCYIVPKVYNPEKTAASIICNGKEVPMTLENGRYTADILLPLFDESSMETVQFAEDGTIRTQQLNWHINPRYDMVPTAYVYYSGESSQNYKGEKITRRYRGSVEIDFEHKNFGGEMKDAQVVLLVNGKEQWRHKPVLEELHRDDYTAIYAGDIEYSFELKRGDTVKMYAEVTDENGWRYRSVLEDVTIGEKGDPIPNNDLHPAEADIYDADGSLLFESYKY